MSDDADKPKLTLVAENDTAAIERSREQDAHKRMEDELTRAFIGFITNALRPLCTDNCGALDQQSKAVNGLFEVVRLWDQVTERPVLRMAQLCEALEKQMAPEARLKPDRDDREHDLTRLALCGLRFLLENAATHTFARAKQEKASGELERAAERFVRDYLRPEPDRRSRRRNEGEKVSPANAERAAVRDSALRPLREPVKTIGMYDALDEMRAKAKAKAEKTGPKAGPRDPKTESDNAIK